MSYSSLETRISAIYDDGSAEGVVKTKSVSGNLVRVPFSPGRYYAEISGSATAAMNATEDDNTDGSNQVLSLSATGASNPPANGVSLWVAFYGSKFGLRFIRNSFTPNFCVWIDGVSYGVNGILSNLANEGVSLTDDDCAVLIADDLPDPPSISQPHIARILMGGYSTTQTLYLLGMLLEQRVGYTQPSLTADLSTTTQITVTTSGTATAVAGKSGVNQPRGCAGIKYYNSTGAPITVTLLNNGTAFDQYSVPANSSVFVPFTPPLSVDASAVVHGMKHFASVNAGLYYTLIGVTA